jgi:hypothetical protein
MEPEQTRRTSLGNFKLALLTRIGGITAVACTGRSLSGTGSR